MTTKKTKKKAPAPKATKAAKAAPAKKASARAAASKPVAAKPVAKPVKIATTNVAEQAKKLSAIDAAAQVLADSGHAMNAKQMIEAMAAKGLWTSPGGKTPHATLYSSIIREIATKGNEARFKKTERGQFAANG